MAKTHVGSIFCSLPVCIRTTTAVTKIIGGNKLNALPSHVVAYVNHRVHPNDSMEFVAEHDR